jgi:hypothetical protein
MKCFRKLQILLIIATFGIWYIICRLLFDIELSHDLKYFKSKYFDVNDLYKSYSDDGFIFDTDKEIPLIFMRKAHITTGPTSFLITNKYFYYRLSRTKRIRDTGKAVTGKIFLGDIKKFDTKDHTVMDMVSIFVNGDLIGAFDAEEEKISAWHLKEYFSGLTLQGDSLITSVDKVPVVDQKKESDSVVKLKQLKDLFDQGVLTEEEFNTKKQELLNKL